MQLTAQTDKEKAKFLDKIAKSDTEIADPKKGIEPKTWISRAELFKEIYDAPRKNLMIGMAQVQVKIVLKEEKSQRADNREIDGVSYEILPYPGKKLYFNEAGMLRFWEIDDKVVELPLLTVFDAYSKAYELDEKKSFRKKITDGFNSLTSNIAQEAEAAYNLHKYDIALIYFEKMLDISDHPAINVVDSANIYNTGLVARLAGNDEKALTYFGKAIAIGYDQQGNAYANYAALLREKGDTLKSKEILNQAFVKYPKNQDILVQLINTYMSEGSDLSEALPYIKEAQNNEPENASLYNAEGIIYEQLKNLEKAVESYSKALAIAPDYFAAQYSIGALYYNHAVEIQNNAANELDDNKYKELLKEMEAEFEKSLPYLERAHELAPEERSIVESIKSVYYRFREKSPEMNEKFEYYSKLSETMQAGDN
jgi:tetratricopeptide (TPR) repeat protein